MEQSNVQKPVVNYRKSEYDFISVGRSAWVYALNHPRLGELEVRTSTVQSISEDGTFETLNTIYKPV